MSESIDVVEDLSEVLVIEILETVDETEVVEVGAVSAEGVSRADLEAIRQEMHDGDQELAGLIADTRTEVIRVERDLGDQIEDAQDSLAVALAAHIEHETPHPAYDDMPSLVLIYENGLTS